jgi:hypothetical protein
MAGRQSRTDTIALGRLTRHEVCNPFRLSTEAGIPGRSLYNAVEGLSPLTVPDLRLVVAAMARLGQEEDALELVRGLLDLESLGWDLRHAPRPAAEAALAAAGLHAAGAAGEAVGEIAEAAADGKIDAGEAAELEPFVAHARHKFDQLLSFLRGHPRGQAALPGVPR